MNERPELAGNSCLPIDSSLPNRSRHSSLQWFNAGFLVCSRRRGISGSEYRERLLQSGFQAFLPYERYKESFCEAHDIQAHSLYMREKAKESLGQIGICPPLLTGEGLGYRSPVLEELRRQRDARIGCSFREARQRQIPAFELEIDPCERRYMQIRLLDPSYRAREEEKQLEKRRLLTIEAQRHASGLALSYAMDKPDKLAFFYEVMTRELAPHGLEYTKRFSTKYPVFSKELGNGWYLCGGWKTRTSFGYLVARGRSI